MLSRITYDRAEPAEPAAREPGRVTTGNYLSALRSGDLSRRHHSVHQRASVQERNCSCPAANVDRQLKFDAAGYCAVGEDMIVLLGVDPNANYDPGRDWYMPGTQDAIQDGAWQVAAVEFAKRYNHRRAGKSG
jgi:hypothetical protein